MNNFLCCLTREWALGVVQKWRRVLGNSDFWIKSRQENGWKIATWRNFCTTPFCLKKAIKNSFLVLQAKMMWKGVNMRVKYCLFSSRFMNRWEWKYQRWTLWNWFISFNESITEEKNILWPLKDLNRRRKWGASLLRKIDFNGEENNWWEKYFYGHS